MIFRKIWKYFVNLSKRKINIPFKREGCQTLFRSRHITRWIWFIAVKNCLYDRMIHRIAGNIFIIWFRWFNFDEQWAYERCLQCKCTKCKNILVFRTHSNYHKRSFEGAEYAWLWTHCCNFSVIEFSKICVLNNGFHFLFPEGSFVFFYSVIIIIFSNDK